MGLEKDINITQKILKKQYTFEVRETFLDFSKNYCNGYGEYSVIYPFTNDYLEDYKIKIKNPKDVFCVASSGDHALWSILNGAEKVTTFDINVLSYYYQALKVAAVRALDHSEFLMFFGTLNNDLPIVNDALFEKVCAYLNKPAQKYWRAIYYSGSFKNVNKIRLFSLVYSFSQTPYYFEDSYNELRQRLSKIEEIPFINTNIYNLSSKLLDKKVDTILLSNIVTYYNGDSKSLKKFINSILGLLKEDGVLELNHFCSGYGYSRGKVASNKEKGNCLFDKIKSYVDEEKLPNDTIITSDSKTVYIKKEY